MTFLKTFRDLAVAEASNRWGELYYDLTSELLHQFPCPDILEIGVAYGAHALKMINIDNCRSYTGVDPYSFNYDISDPYCSDIASSVGLSDQRAMDLLYHYTSFKLSRYSNCSLFRDTIDQCRAIKNNTFDFIFIDGDHRKMECLLDLVITSKLIRPGGVVALDDCSWDSVSAAVKSFADLTGKVINKISNERYFLYYFQW